MAALSRFGKRGQSFVASGRCYSCGLKHPGSTARCEDCLQKKRDYARKQRVKKRNAAIWDAYLDGMSLGDIAKKFHVSYANANAILTIKRKETSQPPVKVPRRKRGPDKVVRSPSKKLPPEERNQAIANLRASGGNITDLAAATGLSYGRVSRIISQYRAGIVKDDGYSDTSEPEALVDWDAHIPDDIQGRTRKIVLARLSGKTLRAIARDLGVSPQAIHRIIKKAGMTMGSMTYF